MYKYVLDCGRNWGQIDIYIYIYEQMFHSFVKLSFIDNFVMHDASLLYYSAISSY